MNTLKNLDTDTTQSWYMQLVKPGWAPEPSVFGQVWSVLYIMIATAFIHTCYKTFGTGSSWPSYIFYVFLFNIFANVIFTPIQFGLRNIPLAMGDILLILVSCFALLYYIYPYSKWTAVLLVPYTIWVCIATTLQASITYLNR